MSALGGIYNFDGALVDAGLLHVLGEGLTARGPDGGREHQSDSIGMAYRAFNTTQEAWQETQPLVSHDGYILTWDGRLDNRDVLLADLPSGLLGDTTDVALVMAAYLRWGTGFLTRLVGDFALSLWDSNTRTLLLARDAFGTRPLYYHTNAKRIVWSSEMQPLLDLDDIEVEIDDDYIAGYLTDRAELWHTPYKSIRAVQPGHVLIVRDAQIQERRFWTPDPKKEIRYKSDSEYEEHFRLLFRESVRNRLRSDRPVWSQLSGGFDSSSIVCVADQIIAASEAPISELETVSYIYDDSPTSDEREFIACVEEQRGSLSLYIGEDDDLTFAYYPNETLASIPNPLIAPGHRYGRMCAELQERGARVLLSGQFGDHLLWSGIDAPPDLADLLVKFKPLELHRQIAAWSRAIKRPYIQLLWKGAVLPILPQRIQASQRANATLPPWLNQGFVRRMKLRERVLQTADTFGFRLPSGKLQSGFLSSAISLMSSGYYRARGGLEIRLPYLHLPLVEFLLAIPFEQKIRPGETRSLHRRALGEVLPARIARRKGKRGTDEAFYRSLAREWSRLDSMFADALVCARGYADSISLREALNRARYGYETYTHMLSRIISIEFWLRALEHRRSEAKNPVVAEAAAF